MTTEWIKDPAARKDYTVDWADFLDGDTISAVAWTVPAGLTTYSSSNSATAATVWLSGGTAGNDYLVTCQVTTAGGRIDQRSFTILCREQ